MKVVINVCFGGFSISREAALFMAKLGNRQAQAELKHYGTNCEGTPLPDGFLFYGFGYSRNFTKGYPRDCPDLVSAVEALGKDASGKSSELKVVEIPNDIEWYISEYDGVETVEEKHRSWS